MRYFLLPLFILLFTIGYSQDVQQVEVIKSDRQVSELLDEIGDHIILGAEEFAKGNNDRTLRLELFYWLITTKRMILKFAFPKHINRPSTLLSLVRVSPACICFTCSARPVCL